MNTQKIPDGTGKGFFRTFSYNDVDKVKPLDFFRTHELQKRATIYRDMLHAKDPQRTAALSDDFFLKHAEDDLVGFFERFEQIPLDSNLDTLLTTTRKKKQIALLKGVSIDTDQLIALILKSHSEYGFLFSRYCIEILPNGLAGNKMPRFIYKNTQGIITKSGETDLNENELKKVLEHRKVTVLNFFEKDDFWHCIFITYNSIAGKENWNNGQAHFHYISSSFGISKKDFIDSVRAGNYKSTSVHIPLTDYGNQSATK